MQFTLSRSNVPKRERERDAFAHRSQVVLKLIEGISPFGARCNVHWAGFMIVLADLATYKIESPEMRAALFRVRHQKIGRSRALLMNDGTPKFG